MKKMQCSHKAIEWREYEASKKAQVQKNFGLPPSDYCADCADGMAKKPRDISMAPVPQIAAKVKIARVLAVEGALDTVLRIDAFLSKKDAKFLKALIASTVNGTRLVKARITLE